MQTYIPAASYSRDQDTNFITEEVENGADFLKKERKTRRYIRYAFQAIKYLV